MARYRKIDTRIWNDAKFNALSERGKLVFFFLLTHPNLTMLGAMRATVPGLAAELGMPAEGFAEAFREVLAKAMGKHDQSASFFWLPNFLRYNRPESPNVVKSWPDAFDLLPECHLKDQLFLQLKAFTEGLSKGFQQAFVEAFAKDFAKGMPNQEQEQEQEQEKETAADADPFLLSPSLQEDFASTWNRLCGNLPKVRGLTASRRKKLQTRIRQGLTLELFEQAASQCASTPFLSGENQRKWVATFDWLIENDSNLNKVLEGSYGSQSGSSPVATGPVNAKPVFEHRSTAIDLSEYRAKMGIR